MKLIKKLNNNYALALDTNGENIIVEGKGIGFIRMPCELEDLSIISRAYYDTKTQDIELVKNIPEEVLSICERVVDFVSTKIGDKLNPNLTFILADHIEFCIERYENNIEVKMPIYYDIEYLYPAESAAADFALKLILEDMNVLLPESEKTGIALNIINSELKLVDESETNHEFVELCISIVEKVLEIEIEKTSFNYVRFVTHLEYLSKRIYDKKNIDTENTQLYEWVSNNYPEIKKCVDVICQVLKKKKIYMNREEKLYLMLHINRVCSREDCNH
ncbi:MAG TPA: PRD domain-containing protein [Thomasclavelia ramosa]|nr:PRD domain-containing protein [Thomasclavelia ramosa]